MDKEIINKFITFLAGETNPMPDAVIYHELKDYEFNAEIIANELNRHNLIDIGYSNSGTTYSLNLPAKNALKHLPREFENDPYGYFLDIEAKSNQNQEERVFLEMEKLRNEFKDYKQTKNIARISLIIAIVIAFVEILKLIF